MTSGGQRRMVLRPAPSTSRPRSKRHFLYAIAQLGCTVFGMLIAHQLETDHQAQSANVADMPETLRPMAHTIENVTADLSRVRDQFTFEQFDGRKRGSHRDRIAAERGGVRTGPPIHDFRARDHRAQRQPARDAFRGSEDVGRDAKMLGGPHLAGTAHAALHFVEDQQDAVTIGQAPQLFEENLRRNQIAAFALDRLDDDARHFLGRNDGAEQFVFNEADATHGVVVRR